MNVSPENIERLKYSLARILEKARALRDFLSTYTAHDYQWVCIIFICAVLLRFPFIAYPAFTEFDEVIYSNYALHTLHGQPFFDIHPPLARMIFAEILRASQPFTTWMLPTLTNQPFGDFPYVAIRYFIACWGTLLPLIIFAIARILKYTPRAAALPALFIVFDNALVLYSRTALPDTLLLVFNFLALGAALLAIRSKQKWLTFGLVVLTGIFLGLALSIKWTALGVLATIWVLFLFLRKYMAIIISGVIATIIYVIIFLSFFLYFPQGGQTDLFIYSLDRPWIRAMEFPKPGSLTEQLHFFADYNRSMVRANKDPEIAKVTMRAPGPLYWPLAKAVIVFWLGDDGSSTKLAGNALLWVLSFFAFLFEMGWIFSRLIVGIMKEGGIPLAFQIKKGQKNVLAFMQKMKTLWPIDLYETILIIGYGANYLPFFFIGRPMFLYHYFTALIFLFLLVPRVGPRIITCLAILSKDKLFAYTFIYFALFLIFVNFFLALPTTYGF